MAKTETKDKKNGGAAPGNARKASGGLLLALVFVLICIFYTASVMVIAIGMIPTLVAFVVDRSPHKYATLCVGGLNLSGVFPYLLDLWAMGAGDMSMARTIVTDPYSLMVMLATAGFGWIVYLALPPAVATVMMILSQKKVAQLRAQQREILEEWGEGIIAVPDQNGGAEAARGEPAPPT